MYCEFMSELVKAAEEESTAVIGRFQTVARVMLEKGHNNPELDPTLEMAKHNGEWRIWCKKYGAAFGFSMKINNNEITLIKLSDASPSDSWYPYTRYKPVCHNEGDKMILEAFNYENKSLGRIISDKNKP